MTLKKFSTASAAVRATALIALTACLSIAAAPQAAPAQTPTPAAAAPAVIPPMNGIAHIAIRVKDIPASVAFYHKLGFDQAFANMGRDGTTITQSFIKLNDRQYIELYPASAQNPAQSTSIFMHLCFEGVDLNAIHDYYVAEGLTPITVRTAGAGNLLFTMKGPQQFAEPQNIEYTQYMPGSKHTLDFGQHISPDRVGDKMILVALAMQDPSAARDFYTTKMGFTPNKTNPTRLDLPGTSGEEVEIVPVDMLGARSSILLESANLDKAAAQLTRQQVKFERAAASNGVHTVDMISITDPDNNIIRLQSTK
jgi:catechol 2,3-dioxygenase-like lactoylglutathione lyase family enzyme